MIGKIRFIAVFTALVLVAAAVFFILESRTDASPEVNGAQMSAGVEEEPGDDTENALENAIVMYIGSPVAYVGDVKTTIDSSDPEVAPVIRDSARLAPLRFIAEKLGASVDWDQKTETASVALNEKLFKFRQNSREILVDGLPYELDTPVQAIKGRTFVPLDGLVQALGKEVFYEKGLIIISGKKDILNPDSDADIIRDIISRVNYLPSVDSHENLMKLLEQSGRSGKDKLGGILMKNTLTLDESVSWEAAEGSSQKAMRQSEAESAGSGDYSATNVQVQGVDEADVVKTDGEYIYQVNRQRVVVARAYPAEGMEVAGILDFDGKDFHPMELYLHEGKMVVIGSTYGNIPLYRADAKVLPDTGTRLLPDVYPPHFRQGTVKAIIYDISDKKGIKQLREVELEGSYVSSRKIGSRLYLISNRYMDYYHIQKEEVNPTPSYRDTLVGEEFVNIDYGSVRYFPGVVEPACLVIAGIDIEGEEAANISAYLGAGQNVYASAENLYIAVTQYRPAEVRPMVEETDKSLKIRVTPEMDEVTLVYKFSLENGKITYISKGDVPGRILNQFSMDENGEYFRIATTRGQAWRSDEFTSRNNIYVLDYMLGITGKVEDIAPGESIYSVRFMGDRAYMVTFEKVDPLFVIDLKDPEKPAVLGALKIPGYSDYLHPYDENHIIGFGKDTVEIKGQAYYQGIKIAMFDVSDVANPVQKFSEIIGGRGTESEILHNHKALLFSREKGIMAFPVTVMEPAAGGSDGDEQLRYGRFAFQGAYVYNVDHINGFRLKGKITHLSEDDYLKAGNGWYESDKNVQRVLYIRDNLYTLSNSMIKANSLEDLIEKGALLIP